MADKQVKVGRQDKPDPAVAIKAVKVVKEAAPTQQRFPCSSLKVWSDERLCRATMAIRGSAIDPTTIHTPVFPTLLTIAIITPERGVESRTARDIS